MRIIYGARVSVFDLPGFGIRSAAADTRYVERTKVHTRPGVGVGVRERSSLASDSRRLGVAVTKSSLEHCLYHTLTRHTHTRARAISPPSGRRIVRGIRVRAQRSRPATGKPRAFLPRVFFFFFFTHGDLIARDLIAVVYGPI